MNRAWAVLWLIACGASPETDVSDTDGHSEDTDSDTDLDTDPVAPPGHVDCAAPLPSPTQRIVPGARGYHGLAFDAEGWMVGSDGTSLVRADATGHTQLLVPNVGSVEQLVFLANGNLIAAKSDSPGLLQVRSTGEVSELATEIPFYGVTVGPDGLIYGAGEEGVYRVDPDTGVVTELIPSSDLFQPHSLMFTPDHTKLIVGRTWPSIPFSDATDEQLRACDSLADYSDCSYESSGSSHPGVCLSATDTALAHPVCWSGETGVFGPSDPHLFARRQACTGRSDGAACHFDTLTASVHGECVTLEGASECWDVDFGAGGDLTAAPAQQAACHGRSAGDSCAVVDSFGETQQGSCYVFDAEPPTCWYFGFGVHHTPYTPSAAQRSACLQAAEDAVCHYENGDHDVVEGICTSATEAADGFGCWSELALDGGSRAQRSACEQKHAGDPCTLVDPLQGRLEGSCEGRAADGQLTCWDPRIGAEPAVDLLYWDVDASFTPTGTPHVYAEGIGGYHDALAFDACGNLWLSDFSTSDLHRIHPDGSHERMVNWSLDSVPLSSYGHAILWGSGAHGWRADAIYVAVPYAELAVKEVVVGIPGAQNSPAD